MPRADGSPTIAEMTKQYEAPHVRQPWPDLKSIFDNSEPAYDYEDHDMHLANVEFNKTGKDIITSLNKKVEGLIAKSEEVKEKIAVICKKRELDPKEVLDAGEDAEKVASYSNKMSNSVSNNGNFSDVPQNIVQSLQQDINNLRVFGSKVARLKTEITDCERVKNNLASQAEQTFKLSYDELVQLGF